jgi:hypothetical protein
MGAEGGAMKEQYFALIGDLVGSRAIEDRSGVQRALLAALEDLNRDLAPETVAAPLRVTAGDGVQGLLGRAGAIVDIVVGLEEALHPVSIIWGVGRGPLATDLHDDVALLDGPCFHRARQALEAARHDGVWLRSEGLGAPHDVVLGSMFGLMGAIRSRWTAVQARYVREARGSLQREVAERLGVSEPAVSKGLSAARFAAVKEAERAARALLEWLGEPDHDSKERSP